MERDQGREELSRARGWPPANFWWWLRVPNWATWVVGLLGFAGLALLVWWAFTVGS